MNMNRQTLLVDADDTLWDNNVFFEQTIDNFLTLVERLGYDRRHVREVLNEIERRNILRHGYGVGSFRRSLEETYAQLAGARASRAGQLRIERLVRTLERTPPRILDGVAETLEILSRRHRLILFTKGHLAEQQRKVKRSGLRRYFEAVEITAEKNPAAYERAVERFGIAKVSGWMIGNSPRSDINPALAAGLNAVFIPHPATWELEKAELASPDVHAVGAGVPAWPRLLVLESFGELQQHF
jgi:putative hydrolase of the HAD superfamily